MKSKASFATTLLLAGILLLLPSANSNAEIIEGIAAIVNDKIITCSEFEERLAPYLQYINKNYEKEKMEERIVRMKEEVLEELIKEKLLLFEAKKKGITVTEEEIEREITNIKRRLGSSEKNHNFTEKKFKRRLEEQLLVMKLIDIEFNGKIEIPSETEIREFFNQHRSSFKEPESVAIRHITVEVKGETKWLEAKKQIEDVHQQLLKGRDFLKLAKKYSGEQKANRNGNLEFISRRKLLPEFENAISTLKVGEISDIIRTARGYHIIKLESIKESRQKEFSEIRGKIENQLYHLKLEEAVNTWAENLKVKAYIQIK